jgi:methionine transaminase
MSVPFDVPSRLPSVGTTIFTVMSRLAAERGAINLSQGFPDFDCDPALVDAVAAHMRGGRNQYAPMQGVQPLREAITGMFDALRGRRYDPDTEVTVTSGGTEALFDAIAAVLHQGDEAIVLEPCYDSYAPAIRLNGGTPVFVPLTYPDYSIDWDRVRAAVSPRTRVLMLNSPHNPSGAVLKTTDMERLHSLVDGTPSSSSATRSTSTSSSTASATRAWRATRNSPHAASSSDRSGRPIT